MDRRACDGPGVAPWALLRAAARRLDGMPAWAQAEGRDVVYAYQGRNAIALLGRLIGLRPGEEVLAPAYNCGAEIDPFIEAGARVVLYDVDRGLGIDVERITAAIRATTRIVYVTHFLGFAQPLAELARVCRSRGVILVEDCAQALFSSTAEGPVGRVGDAAIYSFVKTLAVPDGGALVVNRALRVPHQTLVAPPMRLTIRRALPLFKKWVINRLGVWPARRRSNTAARDNRSRQPRDSAGRHYAPMLRSNCFVPRQANWAMSRVSLAVLHDADATSAVSARRGHYQYLARELSDVRGFAPLIPVLPEGVCPLAFPFFAADRAHWYSRLDARGVSVQGWPGYYPGFDWHAYPGACDLKDNLLTLPIHQYLDDAHMEYVVRCVREVAAGADVDGRC